MPPNHSFKTEAPDRSLHSLKRWTPILRSLLAIVMVVSNLAFGMEPPQSLPADVAAFVEQRDGCDHFRGEEPYDEERRAFLEQNMRELCTGTDMALARLKKKHEKSGSVMSVLNQYEEKIEAGSLVPNNSLKADAPDGSPNQLER